MAGGLHEPTTIGWVCSENPSAPAPPPACPWESPALESQEEPQDARRHLQGRCRGGGRKGGRRGGRRRPHPLNTQPPPPWRHLGEVKRTANRVAVDKTLLGTSGWECLKGEPGRGGEGRELQAGVRVRAGRMEEGGAEQEVSQHPFPVREGAGEVTGHPGGAWPPDGPDLGRVANPTESQPHRAAPGCFQHEPGGTSSDAVLGQGAGGSQVRRLAQGHRSNHQDARETHTAQALPCTRRPSRRHGLPIWPQGPLRAPGLRSADQSVVLSGCFPPCQPGPGNLPLTSSQQIALCQV